MKYATSFRLSDKAKAILAQEAHTLAISRTAVLELLLRQKLKQTEPNIRTQSWLAFEHKHQGEYPSPAQIFHAGFAAGWYAAQEKEHRGNK